jgi:hypothetical protein
MLLIGGGRQFGHSCVAIDHLQDDKRHANTGTGHSGRETWSQEIPRDSQPKCKQHARLGRDDSTAAAGKLRDPGINGVLVIGGARSGHEFEA